MIRIHVDSVHRPGSADEMDEYNPITRFVRALSLDVDDKVAIIMSDGYTITYTVRSLQ